MLDGTLAAVASAIVAAISSVGYVGEAGLMALESALHPRRVGGCDASGRLSRLDGPLQSLIGGDHGRGGMQHRLDGCLLRRRVRGAPFDRALGRYVLLSRDSLDRAERLFVPLRRGVCLHPAAVAGLADVHSNAGCR